MISYQITQGDIFVLILVGVCAMVFIIAFIYNELRFRRDLKELRAKYSKYHFPDLPLPW